MNAAIKKFLKPIIEPIREPIVSVIPDNLYIRWRFLRRTGKILHLNPPVTFNEKLQWLKLYGFKPEYTRMADELQRDFGFKPSTTLEQGLGKFVGWYKEWNEKTHSL